MSRMKFWCIHCLKGWTRKESHDKQFQLKRIAGGHAVYFFQIFIIVFFRSYSFNIQFTGQSLL